MYPFINRNAKPNKWFIGSVRTFPWTHLVNGCPLPWVPHTSQWKVTLSALKYWQCLEQTKNFLHNREKISKQSNGDYCMQRNSRVSIHCNFNIPNCNLIYLIDVPLAKFVFACFHQFDFLHVVLTSKKWQLLFKVFDAFFTIGVQHQRKQTMVRYK